jgi:hypothetical protein
MRLRAMSVLGLFLAAAGTCEGTTEPPPDTCVEGQTMTIGTDVTGAVAGGDCALDDHHADSYSFTLTEQSTIRFGVTGQTETVLRIRDNSLTGEQDVAIHDNGLSQYQTFVVLKPGSYTLDIAADEDGGSGNYTISSAVLAALQPAGCVQPPNQWRFAAVGVTVSGVITSADCAGAPTFFFDGHIVKFRSPGARKITATVSAGGAVEVRTFEGNTLATQPVSRNTAGDIVVQFSPATGYYAISILVAPGSGSVTYTLKIE